MDERAFDLWGLPWGPEVAFADLSKHVHPALSNDDVTAFLQAYKASIAEGPNAGGYKLFADPLPTDQLQPLLDSRKSQTQIVSEVVAARPEGWPKKPSGAGAFHDLDTNRFAPNPDIWSLRSDGESHAT